MAKWLEHHTLVARGPGSFPGQGTKTPQAAQYSQKFLKNKALLIYIYIYTHIRMKIVFQNGQKIFIGKN